MGPVQSLTAAARTGHDTLSASRPRGFGGGGRTQPLPSGVVAAASGGDALFPKLAPLPSHAAAGGGAPATLATPQRIGAAAPDGGGLAERGVHVIPVPPVGVAAMSALSLRLL